MTQAPPVSTISTAPGHAPLSYQQLGWLEAERKGMVGSVARDGRHASNLHAALRIRGRLDVDLMERSAVELVRRHHALRTAFIDNGGETIPVVTARHGLPIEVADLSELPAASRAEHARTLAGEVVARPFDYARDVLLRTFVARLADDDSLLLITMPHLVSDGRSVQVCLRELLAMYRGLVDRAPGRLPECETQYADFAAWQRRWLATDGFAVADRYYREHVMDAPSVMLPTDRPRPRHPVFTAAEHRFEIADAVVAAEMWRVARRLRVAPIVVILAAYVAALASWSEQDDVLLVTPLGGRVQPGLLNAVGFFASFALLRVAVADRPSFEDIVARVRAALDHAKGVEGVPYGFLVELARRRQRQAPWLSISANVVASGLEDDALALPDARAQRTVVEVPQDLATPLSRYDLNLLVAFQGSAVGGVLRYRTQLFDPCTIAAFGRCLLSVLHAATSETNVPFGRLAALARETRSSMSPVRA